jgi:cytochrome P450
VFSPLLGSGIFTQEGAAWKHSRELFRKLFVQAEYQNLDHFREHVDNFIARLPAQGGVIDLQPLLFKLTLDITTALLLGRSVYSLKASPAVYDKNSKFAENFTIAQEGLAKRFRIIPLHFLYRPAKFRHACSEARRFVGEYIKEISDSKQAKDIESNSFFNQVKESITTEGLPDQLLNILLAGRDTTASCLSWTLYVLAKPTIL